MAYPRRGNSRLIWFGSNSIMSGGVDPSITDSPPTHSDVQEGDGELM